MMNVQQTTNMLEEVNKILSKSGEVRLLSVYAYDNFSAQNNYKGTVCIDVHLGDVKDLDRVSGVIPEPIFYVQKPHGDDGYYDKIFFKYHNIEFYCLEHHREVRHVEIH